MYKLLSTKARSVAFRKEHTKSPTTSSCDTKVYIGDDFFLLIQS